MSLPYENASSGQRAMDDIQKTLRTFGCNKFATGSDFATGELFIQFERQGRMIELKANSKGYAAAWLRHHPYNHRMHNTKPQHEAKALKIGGIAVYSVLRDWVKGQVTAIEIGILSFEAAFLAHICLPSGKRVIEELEAREILKWPNEKRNKL